MPSIVAGNEQLVDLTGVGFEPQVTSLTGGGWVVTWSTEHQNGSSYTIYQQFFHADGSASGGQTQVTTSVSNPAQGVQFPKQVSALANGGWVVTWPFYGSDGSGWGVYQQAYRADGSALGGQTLVNTTITGNQIAPLVTGLAGGGWVVTWSYGQTNTDDDVYQQAYHADGSTLGVETRVNTTTAGLQQYQDITALAGGGWVVSWVSGIAGQAGSAIYQQAYNANGAAVGSEAPVTTTGDDAKLTALAGGGWVVTWQDVDEVGQSYNQFSPTGSSWGIYQQVYHADGSTAGGATRVNTNVARDQTSQQATALAGGGWVVTWESSGPDAVINQQAYRADGSALGGQTQIAAFVADSNDPYAEKTAALASGGWVVIWQDLNPVSGVYQQVYRADGSALGAVTLVDPTTSVYVDASVAALTDGGWVVSWDSEYNNYENANYNPGVYQRVFHLAGGAREDFNGNGKSDVLFQNDSGQAATWLMDGTTVTSIAYAGGNSGPDWKLVGTGDFNADGKSDLLFQNINGQVAVWLMDGATPLSISYVGGNPGTAWKAVTTGDFDGDGKSDILLENSGSGLVAIWKMDGVGITNVTSISSAGFHVVSTGDFNNDGKSDILYQAANGQVAAWIMNGLSVQSAGYIGGNPGAQWVAIGTGDLDGDGKSEVVFQNTNGQVAGWVVNGTDLVSGAYISGNPGTNWVVKGTGDLDGDGKADLLFQNISGQGAAWLMNGFVPLTTSTFGPNPGTAWHIIAGTG